MVLECGGNGRSAFSPTARGNQWTNGGAGCAEWTGIALADVLKDAKPKSSAIYTSHYAADLHLSGDADQAADLARRALEKAMEPHTLLVWGMNGQPLPNIHGGPLRLVVPGWAGSASQKWVNRITLIDKEHDGPGMTEFSYRVPIKPMIPGDKGDPKNFKILESMPVRSVITSPANGAKVAAGTKELPLRGAAWAGDLTVKQVDVSTDFGATWQKTTLGQAEEQVRLAALDHEPEAAERRLFRDLGARDGLGRRDAAASGGLLEPARLRRQRDAPHRRAGGVRSRMRFALAIAGLLLAAPAIAQTFTPRDETRRTSPPARAATTPSMPAPPATTSSLSPRKA